MKKLINAGIITIQFIAFLGCVGAISNGTMSFGAFAMGIAETLAITLMCFRSIEKESANEKNYK